MKTITIGCWENDQSPLTSSSDYPLMTKNVLLLYDLTSFKTDMKSAVFYKDGRCVLTSRTTRALFSDLEMQFGMSYAQSKAITQLLTRISTKVPYAINELLYFEIKDKEGKLPFSLVCLSSSHTNYSRKSTDLFNSVQLPSNHSSLLSKNS